MKYLKLPGRLHQWHSNPSCPEWPMSGFIEHEGIPDQKQMCANCEAMTKAIQKKVMKTQDTVRQVML